MNNIAIRVNTPIHLNLSEVLTGISQLDTNELEQFLQKVSGMVAHRKSPNLSERESQLLQLINQVEILPIRTQYELLSLKLQEEQITDNEHEELLLLIEKLEQANVERLKAMVELAQLRGVSLDSLAKQLSIYAK